MKENGTRLVGAGESAITPVLNAAVIIGTESGAGKVEGDGAIVVTHSGAGKGVGANNIAEGAIPATVAGAAVAATDLARGAGATSSAGVASVGEPHLAQNAFMSACVGIDESATIVKVRASN